MSGDDIFSVCGVRYLPLVILVTDTLEASVGETGAVAQPEMARQSTSKAMEEYRFMRMVDS